MLRHDPVSEDEVQEYIDGRLPSERRAAVESWLTAHPERRAEVQALMRQQDALRRLGADILAEPIPDRLQEILRRIPAPRRE